MTTAGEPLTAPTAILLPGLHGSDVLYGDLVSQLDIASSAQCISYPEDIEQSYSELYTWLTIQVDFSSPKVIIAESFSTPLALQIAANFPDQIKAVIIAGGFCSTPISSAVALLPLRPLFMLKPPLMAIQHFLLDRESDEKLLKKVQSVIHRVPTHILNQRIRSILALDPADTPSINDTPTLLLQAQNDKLVRWEVQNQLENHLPHAEVHWLDSPHLLFQSHPKQAANLINRFLEKVVNNTD